MESKLCSFRDQGTAGMMEQILRNRGLHPRPLNTSAHVFLAGAEQWYDLWMPEEEIEIAAKIIVEAGYADALARK